MSEAGADIFCKMVGVFNLVHFQYNERGDISLFEGVYYLRVFLRKRIYKRKYKVQR